MGRKLRVGVAGCGVMGRRHCEAVNNSPLMELAAIAETREDVLKEAADSFKPGEIYRDADGLAEDDRVEAVVIAMPTFVRTRAAMKCLKEGKHLMLEKPVAMNAGEVREMMAAARGLTVGCFSSRYRFLPSAEAAAGFIAGGALGDIRMVRVRAIRPDPGPPAKPPPEWRLKKSLNGGGILMNWGCYDLDYVMGITGWRLKPEIVFARTWGITPGLESRAAPGSEAETHFCALVGCAGGAAVSFERAEFVPGREDCAWEVAGTRGTLYLRMVPSEGEKVVFCEAAAGTKPVQSVVWEGKNEPASMGPLALEDFAKSVLEGAGPRTGLEESLAIQEITDAVYASAETGDVVRV